jgi:hypothetical protein
MNLKLHLLLTIKQVDVNYFNFFRLSMMTALPTCYCTPTFRSSDCFQCTYSHSQNWSSQKATYTTLFEERLRQWCQCNTNARDLRLTFTKSWTFLLKRRQILWDTISQDIFGYFTEQAKPRESSVFQVGHCWRVVIILSLVAPLLHLLCADMPQWCVANLRKSRCVVFIKFSILRGPPTDFFVEKQVWSRLSFSCYPNLKRDLVASFSSAT